MTRNNLPIKPVLLAILMGLIGWLLYVSIEFYEETEESSWSIEALRNPYLAAQQFMQASDIEVTDVDNLMRLEQLSSVGTLFFSDPRQIQTPRQLQQIMDWLELGGNVIYTANSLSHSDDLLLQAFEVEVDWREYDEDNEDAVEEKSLSDTLREYNRQIEDGKSREEIAQEMSEQDVSLTEVSFAENIGQIRAAFDNDRILRHPYIEDESYDEGKHRPFSWSFSDYGVHMMQFEVGSGLLTIVSDPGIWTSYQIFRHDHAYLLWLLSSGEGEFAILRSVIRDSIWVLIGRNTSELLIAASLLLLLWIWRLGYRFGRLIPRDESRRRALGEHFLSLSHYLWHRRKADYLIDPLRQRVLSLASLRLSRFARAGPDSQYRLLAERCDLNSTAVERAFTSKDFNETSFVITVRLLKHIEQSL